MATKHAVGGLVGISEHTSHLSVSSEIIVLIELVQNRLLSASRLIEKMALMTTKLSNESSTAAVAGFELRVSSDDPDVAYVRLPTHPHVGPCKMSKSIRLRDIIGSYDGPDVILDFDTHDILVGIEILG